MGRLRTGAWAGILGLTLCATPRATAREWAPFGVRSLAMGGAGAACERGSFAACCNPALLAFRDHGTEVSLSLSLGMREVNLAGSLDRLSEIDLNDSFDEFVEGNPQPGDPVPQALRNDIATIREELVRLRRENGLQVMPGAALGIQVMGFGTGLYGAAEIAARGVIDPDRMEFIVETGGAYYGLVDGRYVRTTREAYEARSLEYAVRNRLTYVRVVGLAYVEVPLAYGHAFETAAGKVAVGGALKVMPGRTVDMRIDVDTESDQVVDDLEDAQKDTTSWGVDLGAAYVPAVVPGLTVGLVVRNLNTPSFDTVEGESLDVEPQARLGIAFDCLGKRLTLAADVDLTANETLLPGVNAQYAGGGVNFHPFSWLSVRGGAMANLQEADDGLLWTGGLGFGLKWFQLDLSGQYSSETATYDGQDIPRYFRAQAALVSKWR